MDIPKKYLHDKFVLAIISANAFFTVLIILTVLLRLSGNTAGRFIVQYRENLGLNPFLLGNVLSIIALLSLQCLSSSLIRLLVVVYMSRSENCHS